MHNARPYGGCCSARAHRSPGEAVTVTRQRSNADKRRSRAEQVASDVEDEILAARFPVGAHRGRRAEFMERFGISPMIMSETLRILRNRGMVTARPGTGGGI